ncbi:DNA phosphorothioation system sulfurtransferase DndC [Paraburkholderia terricola]|uniref:DNA phosphorothioation system sulfurtransferase DndC n=1 Tax=Paraburkholderia terricola TaxID=169427 RepID=UPI001FD0E668|nr:DNA phosphorothioation system sulfurtransferase DndC [Paraburkholderia terricola]
MKKHSNKKINEALDYITRVYVESKRPWYIGFSGGKDSSAVVKLVFQALRELTGATTPVSIIYCDTGVEIPTIQHLVSTTLAKLDAEAGELNLPIKSIAVSPPIKDRYFVKVIGRGYPPPSNKFRWCTDRLRINPVRHVLRNANVDNGLLLLGVRNGESMARDRTIRRHAADRKGFLRQTGNSGIPIFSPIIDFHVDDVWELLSEPGQPLSIDSVRLAELYKGASGECPIVRDPKGASCGKSRFGCWTCTVVQRDRAVENLVQLQEHKSLQPLLYFRNWLQAIRDDPLRREKRRRNGSEGLGPFTLKARGEILERLLDAQRATKWELISMAEIAAIEDLWALDR